MCSVTCRIRFGGEVSKPLITTDIVFAGRGDSDKEISIVTDCEHQLSLDKEECKKEVDMYLSIMLLACDPNFFEREELVNNYNIMKEQIGHIIDGGIYYICGKKVK